MKYNFIYITTNLINDKQYVGSHYGRKDDNYLGSGRPALLNAIKKYGRENFTREILEECDPSLNLILETKYIKKYNTLSPNGYNISNTGGLGLKYAPLNKQIRKRISSGCKGRKAWNKGIPLSEETKDKLRKINLGKTLSEETKKKIKNSLKGRIPWNTGKVLSNKHKKNISKGLSGNIRKITPDILNEILKMIDDGIFLSKIYTKFNVSYQTIYRIKEKYRPEKIQKHKK